MSRIDDIIADAEADAHITAASTYHTTKLARDAGVVVRFAKQFIAGLYWCWQHMGAPVWHLCKIVGKWLFWKYKEQIWDRVVYKTDPFGASEFSNLRAGLTVAATGVFLFVLLVPLIEFFADATLYTFTGRRDEQVVLFNSQEVQHNSNVHNVEGCYEWPCPDGDSFYFRVKWSLFNDVWKLLVTGHLFYADSLASAVPPGKSWCTITTYGFRQRFILYGLEIYPQIIDIKFCETLKDA